MQIAGLISQAAKVGVGIYFGEAGSKVSIKNDVGSIYFDAVFKENHDWKSTATSNPVEDGSPITDHIINEQDKLSLTGFVSNASIDLDLAALAVATSQAYVPYGLGTIYSDAAQSKPKKVQEAFNVLYALKEAKREVVVATRYKIYSDMVITNISIPREVGDGDAIEINIDFVKISKVSTQMVDMPKGIVKGKAASKRTPTSEEKKGVVQAEKVEGKPKSVVDGVVDASNKTADWFLKSIGLKK